MSIRIATDCKYLTLATVFLCSILMNNILKMTYMAGFNYSLALSGINSAASYMCCALYFRFTSSKRKIESPRENFWLSRLFPSTSHSFVIHVVPLCICQVLAIGFTQAALQITFPSFIAMLSSIQPAVTVVVAKLLSVPEKRHRWQWIALLPIIAGSILTSAAETDVKLLAIAYILGSVFFRVLRSVLECRLLQPGNGDGGLDPVSLLSMKSPTMGVMFALASMYSEGLDPWRDLVSLTPYQASLVLQSTILGMLMNILSLHVNSQFLPTSISVLNRLKSPAISCLSFLLFAHPIAPTQMLGYGVILFGIAIFHIKPKEVVSDDPGDPGDGDWGTCVGRLSSIV